MIPPIARVRFLQRISRQQKLPEGSPQVAILQYDSESNDLRTWFWPMDEQGSRVDTEALLDYRISHKFRGPSCLCASYEYIRVNTPYTESAIYMSTHGSYSGEYLIACAAGRCGYLIFLDRMFGKGGLILGQYPVRDAGEQAPLTVLRLPGLIDTPVSPDAELTRVDNVIASIATLRKKKARRKRSLAVLTQLLALDSRTEPGLPQSQFRKLVGQCTCGMLLTYSAFEYHTCPTYWIEPAVIDLTLDIDDGIIDLTSDTDDDSIIDLTSDTDDDSIIDLTSDTDDDSLF